MAGWYWFSVPIASILAPQPRIMPSYTSPDRPCVSQPKLHARRDSANIPHLHVELHALASRQIMRVYAAAMPFGDPFDHVPAKAAMHAADGAVAAADRQSVREGKSV